MAGIDKIIIKNFKAFPAEETISIDGKNLLIYGENGSGKSSIYWALYTLLQAKDKGVERTKKYFDRDNQENLLNIFTPNDQSFIKISFVDEKEVFYRLDIDGITIEGQSARADDILAGMNNNSDFISHRLLFAFYHFRNSHEIDLWTVFERDVLPFIKTDRGTGEKTLAQSYKEIVASKPFRLLRDGKIENIRPKAFFTRAINKFNEDLTWWINEINQEVNQFYETHFQKPNEEKIIIELKFEDEDHLSFGGIKQKRRIADREYIHQSRDIKDLIDPVIALSLKAIKSDNSEVPITRPQSYLNEAKLTAIALSVRFSLLADHIRVPYEGKVLVLDDLLVSLDMSNRDKVLDIIINEFAKAEKYKVYIFTHDRAFFEMAKSRIIYSPEQDEKEWKFHEVYATKSQDFQRKPKIYDSKDHIAKASYHLNLTHDYPAAANYLRKATEEILTRFLPNKVLKTDAGLDREKLDHQLQAAIGFLRRFNIDVAFLERLKEFVSILLNPLSHRSDSYESVYREEIEKIIDIVGTIRSTLSGLVIREILPRLTEVEMEVVKNDTIVNHYLLKLKDELYLYSPLNADPIVSTCQLEKAFICFEVVNGVKGVDHPFTVAANNNQCDDLKQFYETVCAKENIAVGQNYLDYYARIQGNVKINTLL
ncbi:MAG: ATP-binding protein [Bacteroidota bacterium]